MTITYLAKPGSEFGPCLGDTCKCPEHKATRQKAATLCQRCAKPIGYSQGFHDIGGQLWHHGCAVKAGVLHQPPTTNKEQSNMTPTAKKAGATKKSAPAKKASAAKKTAAPKAAAKPKATVQFFRDGKPITNPSVNTLSGYAFFYTKGWTPESDRVVKDGEQLDRVNVETLSAFLAKKGVKEPKASDYEVTLPNGHTIGAKVGKLVPHTARVPKSETPEAKAKKEADAKGVQGVQTAKKALASGGAAAVAAKFGAPKPKRNTGPITKASQTRKAAKAS